MKDNVIVQVPQPLIHFPLFFVANKPEEGFFYEKPNVYGDLISIQSPRTPRMRELVVFLAGLTFIQSKECQKCNRRVSVSIPVKQWIKTAGFGRTLKEKQSFEEAVNILSKCIFCVAVGGALEKKAYESYSFRKRAKKLPFRKAIFPGLLGDVEFNNAGTITVHVLLDFVEDLDVTALRVSLTHVLSMRGHISRALTFMMYGRQSWSGTWSELAEMVHINTWTEKWKQKQALKKSLDEMGGKGFRVDCGKNTVKITRGKTLSSLLDV